MTPSGATADSEPTIARRARPRVPKAAELVASKIRRQIIRGTLTQGDALPPESALMSEFGVSRPTLREAYRVLEAEKLIEVRRGARGGAHVLTPSADVAARFSALILEYHNTSLADVLEARTAVEGPIVGIVASKRTRADIKSLKVSLRASEEAIENGVSEVKSLVAFHKLVVDLARNNTLSALAQIFEYIIEGAAQPLITPATSGPAAKIFQAAHEAHAQLVELIEARDAARAVSFWREHNSTAAENLLRQVGSRSVFEILN
jgi:DNA-binding FadR family transcriptional regulator